MNPFLRILLVVLIVGGTVLYNWGLIDLRIEEIGYLIGTVASKDEVSNTFGIVAKYELIKRRMVGGENNLDDYELEARILALTAREPSENSVFVWSKNVLRIPIRYVVNGTRFLLGKKIINPKEDDKILEVLEIGYFWERYRKYGEAIKIYDEVIKTPTVDPAIKAAVMVHKAFCISMLGDYEKARSIYEQVINLYPDTDAGILSWKLLDFIQSMERRRNELETTRFVGIEKAREFYRCMDFRSAIKHLSVFLGTRPTGAALYEARYYKGRSHEELGESAQAIREYQTIVRSGTKSQWGKHANRRLLMVGQFYEQRKSIADEARRQLEAYQDQVFLTNVGNYAKLVKQSSLRSELLNEEGEEDFAIKDSLLNSILSMGDLDLSGEKNAAEQQQKLDSIRTSLIERGSMSREHSLALERTRLVMRDPARQPSVIKSVVDGKTHELKYIYSKFLRSGAQLSGRMVVEIKIGTDGKVSHTAVAQSTMGNDSFEEEILRNVENWRFQAIADTMGAITIKYPFEFTDDEGVEIEEEPAPRRH